MHEDLIGKVLLDRYEIQQQLGQGSMADVYLAWDRRYTRHLAIKILLSDSSTHKAFLRQFKEEFKTLSSIQHENIVRTYGLHNDGKYIFTLMEFVEGSTLAQLISSGKSQLSIDQIDQIVDSMASALHYLHKNHIIHGNIKPSNIFLTDDKKILVADFGLARFFGNKAIPGDSSPAYMAPELLRGNPATPASDQYALGVLLFELISKGNFPYTGNHAQIEGSINEKILWEIEHLKPPSLLSLNPSIPQKLSRVISRALSNNQADRYPDMGSFRTEFNKAIKNSKQIGSFSDSIDNDRLSTIHQAQNLEQLYTLQQEIADEIDNLQSLIKLKTQQKDKSSVKELQRKLKQLLKEENHLETKVDYIRNVKILNKQIAESLQSKNKKLAKRQQKRLQKLTAKVKSPIIYESTQSDAASDNRQTQPITPPKTTPKEKTPPHTQPAKRWKTIVIASVIVVIIFLCSAFKPDNFQSLFTHFQPSIVPTSTTTQTLQPTLTLTSTSTSTLTFTPSPTNTATSTQTPIPSKTASPTPTPGPQEIVLTLYAQSGLVPIILIDKNDIIEISASKTWSHGLVGNQLHTYNANGWPILCGHGNCPISSANIGALVGMIGNSHAFIIGKYIKFTANSEGTLYLGMNDYDWADNIGYLLITIKINKP